MRGILLAGGTGSRLDPVTRAVNKHFLPVYDRPMIFYPLETLRQLQVDDVVIITRPEDQNSFYRLLNDTGMLDDTEFTFRMQNNPRGGIAEALMIGAGSGSVALALGDNLFLDDRLGHLLAEPFESGARIYVTSVSQVDAASFAVLEIDGEGRPVGIEEKPADSRSDLVVTGLYLFDDRAAGVARNLQPSARGELEIVDVIRWYLERGELEFRRLPPTTYWADLGTFDRLLSASYFVSNTNRRSQWRPITHASHA